MDEQKQDKKQDVTTNQIMEFLQEHMVMREEFEGLRGEFEGLKREMVTKDELGKMATKDDLRQSLNKQKLEILDAMDDKLANLKGDMLELEPFPQLILGT